MPYSIEKVRDGAGLSRFIDLPFALYRDDPAWVPPVRSLQRKLFDRKSHPFHSHADVELYTASDGSGRVLGRVASIVNHAHNDYHGEMTGFFGFFETVRDGSLAGLLMAACEDRLRKAGMDRVRGPMNFSTNEECGLLVKGFDGSPMIMMPYNPPWYADLLTEAGYEGVMDLHAYSMDSDTMDSSRVSRIAGLVRRRSNAVLRDISMKDIHREVPLIMDIYNECWKDNWGFVPMTKEELDRMADEMKMILVPELAPVIEVEGEPVAFAVTLPDANQALKKAGGGLLRAFLALKAPLFRTRIDQIRVLLLGVREAFRGRGLESLLIDRIVSAGTELGVKRAELSWILDDNVSMRRILEKDLKAHQYRTYRIYEKKI